MTELRTVISRVCAALFSFALANAGFAQSLVGTWEGSLTCRDVRTKLVGGPTGPLTISQDASELRVHLEALDYYGIIFPNGGGITFPPDATAGNGFLVACSAHPDGSYNALLPMTWKVNDDGRGSLKISGTYTSYYGHGTCKGSFVRTSTSDPNVSSCP
jgi:hypothetical protein